MTTWLVLNVAFVVCLSVQWYLYRNTTAFLRHYFVSISTLLLSAFAAFGLAAAWLAQGAGAAGIIAAVVLCLIGALFAALGVIKLAASTEARPLRLGKLFRNLTRHEATPLAFSVNEQPGYGAWDRPRRTLERFELDTDDGVKLRGIRIACGHPAAVIIAHGSFRSKDSAPYVFLAEWLAYKYDVIAFDFRGHGESGGQFDFGDGTVMDLKAVVDFTRSKGYKKVGLFARSMGASTAILEVAQYRNVDSVVAAAAPLHQVTDIDTGQQFLRVASIPVAGWLIARLASLIMAVLRATRMAAPARTSRDPVDVIADIAPIPLFLVYQEWDWVIKTDVEDAHNMAQAAGDPKRLLILAGPGHIFEVHQFHRLCSAIEDWFDETLRFPEEATAVPVAQ